MSNQNGKLSMALFELDHQLDLALRDRRRLFCIGIINPILTVTVALTAYYIGGTETSVVAVVLGLVKDSSIWAGICSPVQGYLHDRRFLSAEVGKIRVFCEFVNEGDEEGFEEAKSMIMAFFDQVKTIKSGLDTQG